MKEKNKRHEIFVIPIATLGLLAIASLGAFSRKTRKEIGRRDHWTCQSCGKQFKDGWMVHAAHNPDKHHKGNHYDLPSSGSIQCIDCHQKQHEDGTTLGKYGDSRAVDLLKATDRHTRKWRKR